MEKSKSKDFKRSRLFNYNLFHLNPLSTSTEAFKYFYHMYYIKSILFMKIK